METGNISVLDFNQFINPIWQSGKPIEDNEKESASDFDEINTQIKINGDDKPVTEFDPVSNFLQSQVYDITIPKKWEIDGILSPTIICKEETARIVTKLYKNYKIIPLRVSATIEEGTFLKYKDYNSAKELSIEIYNDLDIAAIITQNNRIIRTIDIIDENFEEVIKIFQTK